MPPIQRKSRVVRCRAMASQDVVEGKEVWDRKDNMIGMAVGKYSIVSEIRRWLCDSGGDLLGCRCYARATLMTSDGIYSSRL